jgi:triosephosphate isomerase
MVAMKVLVAAKSGFRIVLCFGEEMRDEEGAYLDVLKKQLIARLALVPRGNLDRVTLAYEPIWAIGKNATGKETPDDLHQISIFARKTLIELFGKPSADKVAFLYGGSVDETNAASFVTEGMADGLLVGRASRDVSRFTSILHAVSTAS